MSYGNQASILKTRGQLDEAMALLKKQEAICLELGNKHGLKSSYGDQAGILKAGGRLDEAMALHKKEEAACLLRLSAWRSTRQAVFNRGTGQGDTRAG